MTDDVKVRSIGILGPSYCGSTMLGCILGSLENCAYIGESHWIGTDGYECRCKSAECELNDPATVERLCKSKGRGWWRALGKVLGVGVVVSGDKGINNYETLGHPGIALILRKDVREWVVSYGHYRSLSNGGPELLQDLKLSDELVVEYAGVWRTFYGQLRAWAIRNSIPALEVSLTDFLIDPESELERLCFHLGITFDVNALYFERRVHHHFGGNAQVGLKKKPEIHVDFNAERRKLQGGYPRLVWKHESVLTVKQVKLVTEEAGA